jgi:hypothetical protein
MYEALRTEVRWETELAPGGLLHTAAFDESGDIHVADVWNSEAEMNAFVAQRLVPGFQKVGAPMPQVSVFPVHNINVHPDALPYVLKRNA